MALLPKDELNLAQAFSISLNNPEITVIAPDVYANNEMTDFNLRVSKNQMLQAGNVSMEGWENLFNTTEEGHQTNQARTFRNGQLIREN